MSTEHSGRVFPTPFAGRRDLTHVIPRDSVELQHSSSLNSPSFTWIQQDPPIIRQKLHRRTHSTGVRSDNRTPSKRKPLSSLSSPEICTPSHTPVFLLPHPERPTVLRRTSSYYSITPSVHHISIQSSAPALCSWDMLPDSGDDGDDNNMIQAPWLRHKHTAKKGSPGFKEKLFSFATGSNTRSRERLISTKPGERGAGETETEIDEPPRHLPTSRKTPLRRPLVPPNLLQQRLTPLLFEFSQLLSVVPAFFGILFNIYHIYLPPNSTILIDGRRPPERIDYIISALWALLTGYQCLCLTTGLLVRWRVYYPPLATLIRLISLQAICWPATHFTLSLLEHEKRPVIVWAVIGTTTCASRSVQIWVTSNLWWEYPSGGPGGPASTNGNGNSNGGIRGSSENDIDWQRWKGGKWGGRRWDWSDVVKKCMLPAGVVYCIMAWAEQLRREWSGC